ncbi:5-deoxy-glucuronate isomerase [Zooshikella harenae]|uniref:5-deoxy-glucuronate isomerase n=1 Tax=Zooshikella harenae TaxID=2827238 RepID=A0ABS5ZB09_9GAMM|nr:5-deoxy-glucuronate isomerase [Zooshikella harenae]MBU2711179.1 5-deoxy-glucuronate isomerase [Zooshikella harenae]
MVHITQHREGFAQGKTEITKLDEIENNTGIAFSINKFLAGEAFCMIAQHETAWLLISGKVSLRFTEPTAHVSAHVKKSETPKSEEKNNNYDKEEIIIHRNSLFDDEPQCLHVCAGTEVIYFFHTDTELAVFDVANDKPFAARLITQVADEQRGKGLVGNSCLRLVRTLFDRSNSDVNAELVLGEVVTLPGRWSSYPPHYHPQPEIYHYRFTEPQGFGHGEHGEDVYKIKANDTLKIMPGHDHAQVAAPGYGMWYVWAIRHLPDNPYIAPTFREAHRWTMSVDNTPWQPHGLEKEL